MQTARYMAPVFHVEQIFEQRSTRAQDQLAPREAEFHVKHRRIPENGTTRETQGALSPSLRMHASPFPEQTQHS